MEFLNTFEQKTSFDECLEFVNYSNLISGIYGAPNISNFTLNKISDISPLLAENNGESDKYLKNTNEQHSGIRMIIKTDSSELALKVHLKRGWTYQNIMLYCSSGFDIYQVRGGKQIHSTVIAPDEPYNIFAHKIKIEPNLETVIYFPTYNKIIDMEIGVKKGCSLVPVNNFYSGKPIVFYGNSCTQGASASRSGNAFVNIISRIMSSDVINYSFSAACRAEQSMANLLTNLDMSALIIDYTRNAISLDEFYQRFEPFYREIKEQKPNLPIIIIGALDAVVYDKHIVEVFSRVKKEFVNTFYIDLSNLFKDLYFNGLSADGIHYSDVGMWLIAEKIMEYLNQVI